MSNSSAADRLIQPGKLLSGFMQQMVLANNGLQVERFKALENDLKGAKIKVCRVYRLLRGVGSSFQNACRSLIPTAITCLSSSVSFARRSPQRVRRLMTPIVFFFLLVPALCPLDPKNNGYGPEGDSKGFCITCDKDGNCTQCKNPASKVWWDAVSRPSPNSFSWDGREGWF